jgi:Sulfotransferase family
VAPLKVLSVVGPGRSGTTVLGSVLGEVDGFASMGELRWLWERGVKDQRPCGCGRKPEDCPVWSPVIEATRAVSVDGRPLTFAQLIDSQHELARFRYRLRVLRAADSTSPQDKDHDWPAMTTVRTAMGEACRVFADVTGSRVVIDTSKRPHDAAVLAGTEGVDHYVVHMVRDPRGVVHSWRRGKTFSVAGETRTMGTRRMPSSVRRWIANCLGSEVLRRRIAPSRWLELRYEDFARDPAEAVARITALLGEQGSPPFESDGSVFLHPNHMVAGNPSRFTLGTVTIRSDEAWRTQMARRHQWLVELATKPLMRRYGYGGRHGRIRQPRQVRSGS